MPAGANRVRQFSLHHIMLVTAALLIVCSGAYFFSIITDYYTLKTKLPTLTLLDKERSDHRQQLAYLARRIIQLTREIRELEEIDQRLRVMMNLEEAKTNGEFMGVGGSPAVQLASLSSADTSPKKTIFRMHRTLEDLTHEVDIRKEGKIKLHQLLENQKMLLACTPSIWPVRGWLSSSFGYRLSPFSNAREFHKGIDISTRLKSTIVAPADGTVVFVGRKPGYGKIIRIDHGHGVITKYAHLHKPLTKRGQNVKRGEKIALVGNTGRSTGPHLHYEIRRTGIPVDPLRYIVN